MKQIWIVDDDQEMTSAIKLMLKLLDCNATGFSNARSAAQKLLAGRHPDLILLDINLGEVSGLDLLEFMRMRNELKNLPVVMLSTEAADVTVDKAMGLGADGYVLKPVTIEELEKALSTAFQKNKKG